MRCNNKTLLGAWLAPIALGAVGAPPVLAQDAIVLEEITVTAQRREELLAMIRSGGEKSARAAE